MPLVSRKLTVLLVVLLYSASAQEQSKAEIDRLHELGRQKFGEGKLKEAEDSFQKILALRPDIPEAHYFLGRIAAAREDYAAAEQFYQRSLNLKADFVDASLGIAEIALAKERPQEAISRLEGIVRQAPSARAHFLLARAWAQVDANRSLLLLEKVFEASPEEKEAWELWADIMTAAGRYEDVVSRLQQQLQKNPASAYLHLLLAQIHVNSGALGKAEQEFWQAEKLTPETSDLKKRALYSLGYLQGSLGRIEEGERLLRRVLAQDSSYLPAITGLADLLIKTGRAQEAGQLLARARQIQPENPEVLLLAGQYHLKQKEWSQAAGVMTELLQKHPDHLQAHFFLGQALKEEGKTKEAMRHFHIFGELKKKARAETLNRRRGLAVEGAK